MGAFGAGRITRDALEALFDGAVRDTLRRFEETGSPVVTDGEQRKPSFATYPIHGASNLAPGGVTIPFRDGHTRQLPVLTSGPFRYTTYAASYLEGAQKYATRPMKEAVIAASALSLCIPAAAFPRIRARSSSTTSSARRRSTSAAASPRAPRSRSTSPRGASRIKLDPSKTLLDSFVDLNNRVLGGFSAEEKQHIGIHTCPGGDQDSTHSADVDYAELLPALFRIDVGNFFVQLASESDRPRVLKILGAHAKNGRRIFVGVTDPISPRVETPAEVRDRILEAAKYIDPANLGSTDDCGFSPFGDDTSTSRDTAFAKIKARVEGNAMASQELRV